MESILHQLYSGEYDSTPKRDKTQQQLYHKLYAELDKVQAVFGEPFLDHLIDLDTERQASQYYQYYRAGFLTGARLMLEVLEA